MKFHAVDIHVAYALGLERLHAVYPSNDLVFEWVHHHI